MERTRARRAQKSLWPTRLAALAVPAALVGLLSSGVAIAAWPSHDDVLAQPAVSAGSASASSSPAAARDDSTERTTRLLADGRPALSATDSAAAAAKAKAKAAEKKAEAKAKAKAAEKDEAEKKAARAEKKKAAAEKRAAAEKKAEKKATAKKKAAAEKAAAKKRAQVFRPTAAQLEVAGHRYSRVSLNVRTQPKSSSDLVTVVKRGTKLSVTDTTKGGWTLVIYRDKPRWVHTEYLVKDKPKKVKAKSSSSSSSSGGGISSKACSSGSGMESGLTQDAVRVHRAVCAEFPSVKSYGGMRSGGDSFHSSGRAVDIMVSGSRGQAIADWVRSHRKALGVSEIIWSQQIWTVQRGGEGWRSMSDRGNATANHYDHVHVSVYGNRGSS